MPPPISVEQYERFEGYPGLKDELIWGEIVLSPQPKPRHQQVAKNLSRLLDSALSHQSYTSQQNSNIRFSAANSMPAPDVFVIAKEQWNAACKNDDYLSDVPVLVAEILSPANRKRRGEEKVQLYLSLGVKAVWLIYPKKQSVEVIDGSERRFVSGVLPLPEPLSGEIETTLLFDEER